MTRDGDIPRPVDRDTWEIQGDYLVRVRNKPRTTLFTPPEVIDTDPPPVPIGHLEVTRLTKPEFS